MRTARCSSRPQGGLPQCMLGYTPLGVGLETPLDVAWIPLGVGLETPLGVGMETPRCGPGDTPLGVGLETPLARLLNFPPWCGPRDPHPLLQGMLGYHL